MNRNSEDLKIPQSTVAIIGGGFTGVTLAAEILHPAVAGLL
jgi:NADH dehydrogenase FAD-containing subunit